MCDTGTLCARADISNDSNYTLPLMTRSAFICACRSSRAETAFSPEGPLAGLKNSHWNLQWVLPEADGRVEEAGWCTRPVKLQLSDSLLVAAPSIHSRKADACPERDAPACFWQCQELGIRSNMQNATPCVHLCHMYHFEGPATSWMHLVFDLLGHSTLHMRPFLSHP